MSIKAVEQIEAKPLPLTSKVMVEREDYDRLVTAAQKYIVQEKKESKLKKLLEGSPGYHYRSDRQAVCSPDGAGCDEVDQRRPAHR